MIRPKSSLERQASNLPVIDNIIKHMAKILFFCSNFDPMAIYKGNFKHNQKARYKLYLRPELRLELKPMDKWRRRVGGVSNCCFFYMIIRFSMICFVQLAKYQATTFVESKSERTIHVIRDTELIRFLKTSYLYYFFSNVLTDFPGVALFMHLCLVASVSYGIYYLPRHYNDYPADAVDLRMALDPCRERKRLDLLIEKNVQQLASDMNTYYKSNKFNIPQNFRRKQKFYESRHRETPDTPGWQAALVGSVGLELMRPSQYWTGHRRYWFVVRNVFIVIVGSSIAFAINIQLHVFDRTKNLRCKVNQIPASICTMTSALDLFEIFSLIELQIVMYWMGTVLCVSLLGVLAHVDAQLQTVNELERDMGYLLDALKLTEGLESGLLVEQEYHSADQSSSTGRTRRLSIKEPSRLSIIMLKVLGKTNVLLGEIKARTIFISEQVSSLLVLFGAGIVLALTAYKMYGPDIEALRANVIVSLWGSSNVILIVCAHEYSRMIRLERLGWPIVARLNSRLAPCHLTSQPKQDPLVIGWRKLIEEGCLIDPQNSVRPFGVSLTFKQILHMNFYITSLAALVLR